jgi:hypothetical protein
VTDVQLNVSPLDPDQRVEAVDIAPAEPPSQLGGVQDVVWPEYLARYETAANWPGFICSGWNGINLVCDIEGSCGLSTASGADRHTSEAPPSQLCHFAAVEILAE